MDEYENAYDCLRKAEKIFLDETGYYTLDLAENYAELGLWRQASMIIDSAITYYQRSTDFYLEVDFKRKLPLGWLYSNLGKCYRIKGKFRKLNEYISKAISIYGRYKEKRGLEIKPES